LFDDPPRMSVVAAFVGDVYASSGSDFPGHPPCIEGQSDPSAGFETARKHDGNSGFRLLPVGIDGFVTRVQMANAAERTLDMQYFIS
jgi:hypothetical protein